MKSVIAVGVLVGGLVLASKGYGGVMVAALVVAALLTAGGAKLRSATGQSSGGQRATIARHEAGHAAAAKLMGARIKGATMGGSGGPYVRLADPESLTSRQYIAFQRTAHYAAGTREGCSADEANIRKELQRIPKGDRAKVLAAADADARRYARSPLVDEYAKKLAGKGNL